ncbi:MAG: PTS sugar transporter subunit IIC [Gemmatimonadales bacterium]
MTEIAVVPLLVWATLAGLDLASVLQGLLNRPLVAGGIAGAIIGDPATGLVVGGALELYALDVLPVGSARYPDYGAASVAAVVYGAGQPWASGLGPAVLLGLVLGQIGGWGVVQHRRANAASLARRLAALDRGDRGVAPRLHRLGLVHDLIRSLGLALLGIGAAAFLGRVPRIDPDTGYLLTLVAVGGGVFAAIGGALHRAGTPRRIAWLGGGLALGVLLVEFR